MLIEAKFIRCSCDMEDLRHDFINFNFENYFSQLVLSDRIHCIILIFFETIESEKSIVKSSRMI